MRRPGRRALSLMASGATCVQRLDGSRDSAIHTKYRISLRSSSMREPRYPLPRVVMLMKDESAPSLANENRGGMLFFSSLSSLTRFASGFLFVSQGMLFHSTLGEGGREWGASPPRHSCPHRQLY